MSSSMLLTATAGIGGGLYPTRQASQNVPRPDGPLGSNLDLDFDSDSDPVADLVANVPLLEVQPGR